MHDQQTAVGPIVQRFRDLELPAADRERQPGHGAGLGIDRRAHDAGSATAPGCQYVVAGEICGLAGSLTQSACVQAALRSLELDGGRFSRVQGSWKVFEPEQPRPR